MKVYLVTDGSGEDGDEWSVYSVHATREGAETESRRLKSESDWRQPKVEEWDLQP